jgi:hypothetical protein
MVDERLGCKERSQDDVVITEQTEGTYESVWTTDLHWRALRGLDGLPSFRNGNEQREWHFFSVSLF